MSPSRTALRIPVQCQSNTVEFDGKLLTLAAMRIFVIFNIDIDDGGTRVQVQSLLFGNNLLSESPGRLHVAIVLQKLQDL